MKKNDNTFFVTASFIFSIMAYIFFVPDKSSGAARNALNLCAYSLIPSLFPMLVVSDIYSKSTVSDFVARVLYKPLRIIFGIPEKIADIFALSLVSGFPIGAVTAKIKYESGRLNRYDASLAVCLCSNASPVFLISVIGYSYFESVKIGVILLSSQIFALVAASRLIQLIFKREKTIDNSLIPEQNHANKSFSMLFTEAVRSGVENIFIICGFVVIFSVVTELCVSVFSFFGARGSLVSIIRMFSSAIFEISQGTANAAMLGNGFSLYLCAAIIGFSGLSVLFQTYSVCGKEIFSLKMYLTVKLMQTLFIPSFVILFMRIFDGYFEAFYDISPDALPKEGNRLMMIAVMYVIYSLAVIFVIGSLYIVSKFHHNRDRKGKFTSR